MCGITGYWQKNGSTDRAIAERMALRIRHRGPDDAGVWIDEAAGLALAHRRLSIIDLSPAGHQPMVSPCGILVLVYNGEIYNHSDIRAELESEGEHFAWRGHSDTETLLAALRHWGIAGALQRLNGMFAFALWDRSEQTLVLARDRMGEKPLYYGTSGDVFLFGSELKALRAHPSWRGEVDRNALALFMRHNYVPSPWSIYQGIRKLPPAHFVTARRGGRDVSEPQCYWNLSLLAEQGAAKAEEDPPALIDELDRLLRDAVGLRMAADVPLGAFLSGGYDSTMVAAQMQAQSQQPVKTFSIGFYESAYNEAKHAKAVAAHLGTDHTELYVTPEDAIHVIPRLPTIWDEPFSDSSQIPTCLVSELARRHVTVSLSGDGGDELFYGYDRYFQGYGIWRKLRILPPFLREILGWGCAHAPGGCLERFQNLLPREVRISDLSDRLPKIAGLLRQRTEESFYQELTSHWKCPDKVVLGGHEPKIWFTSPDRMPHLPGMRERMMYLDAMMYLPDDILTKVDRASMAVSLEARVPLLDHRLVEFAWRVPTSLKYRNKESKWLLRQVLYRYVPKALMDRPKMGFTVPVEEWLRGALREWAEDLFEREASSGRRLFPCGNYSALVAGACERRAALALLSMGCVDVSGLVSRAVT